MTLFRCNFYVVAGVALDSVDGKDISIIKKQGKVKALEEEIFYRTYTSSFLIQLPITILI